METIFHLHSSELGPALIEIIQKNFAGQNLVIKVAPEDNTSHASADSAAALLAQRTQGLSAAGNVLAPAFYVLQEQGYSVAYDDQQAWWVAGKAGAVFIAYSTIELCGLVYLHERKGEHWRVSDEAIDAYMKLENTPDLPDWSE